MRKPRAATIAAALATALALFAGFPIPAHAEIRTSDVILGTTAADRGIVQGELPDITAPHAMVLGQDGLAYYERNADEPIKIASVTKVMTALVALEHCELTDIVTVDYAAATVGESSLGLLEGDALTMEDALTGLMVMSGNDAATAIAIAAGAKIDPATPDPYSTFIEAMNQKAKELGFDAIARNLMYRDPNYYTGFGNSHIAGDWVHTNSMSVLGPNKWYDAGDKRFHPDNIIIDCRDANIILIIEKATGDIVWKIGPYFDQTPELRKLGWIIGQHHAHMIPRGLPGEGNILIYDNGGWAGYYAPNPGSPTGIRGALRDYSRVLEIDPVTLEIVWQMTPKEAGYLMPLDANRFYSPFISGMQRLPNGNTMITEGSHGRIFEVTPEHELVWEYVCPYWGTALPMNMVYRSYRLPYEWVPQLEKPAESPIERLDVSTFRVPGAAAPGVKSAVKIKEAKGYFGLSAMCVAADIEE